MSTPPDSGPWAPAQPPPTWPAAPAQPAAWPPPAQPAAWPPPAQPASWSPREPEPPLAARQPTRVPVSTFVVTLLCAVVVAGLIGAFVARGSRSASSTSGAPAPTPTVSADGPALRALIVQPPAGSREVTFQVGDKGVFDLGQFVKNYFSNSNSTEADLRSLDFQWMAQRGWVGPDGIQIVDQLVEFDTASHARQFVLKQDGAYSRDSRYTSTFQVPGGNGYERSAFDPAGFYRASVIGAKDNVAVVLLVFTPGDFNRTEESQVLNAQLAALP